MVKALQQIWRNILQIEMKYQLLSSAQCQGKRAAFVSTSEFQQRVDIRRHRLLVIPMPLLIEITC